MHPNLVSVKVLPDDKVEVGEGEHDDAEEGGEGAVEDRRQHVLQRHHHAPLTAPDARDETLKQINNKRFQFRVLYRDNFIIALPSEIPSHF